MIFCTLKLINLQLEYKTSSTKFNVHQEFLVHVRETRVSRLNLPMNSNVYRNVLRTLEHWPLDQTKKGRDFGEFIRKQVGIYFTASGQHTPKEPIWDDISLRLSALASNKYKQRFAVPKVTGSSGLSEEECKLAISTESLKELEQEFSAYGRFVGRIRQTKNRFFPPKL